MIYLMVLTSSMSRM